MTSPCDSCKWCITEKVKLEGGGHYYIYGVCNNLNNEPCLAETWFAHSDEWEGDTPEQKMYLAGLGPLD